MLNRTNVNVTFWDKYAQVFVEAIWKKMETPVIIILAGCRVQMWSSMKHLESSFGLIILY